MATYSNFCDKGQIGWRGKPVRIVDKYIRLSSLKNATSTDNATVTGIIKDDVLNVFSLDKGTVVLAAGVEVVTASTGAGTATLNVGATAYATGFATNTTGVVAGGTTAHIATAAEKVSLTCVTGPVADGVIRVWMVAACLD